MKSLHEMVNNSQPEINPVVEHKNWDALACRLVSLMDGRSPTTRIADARVVLVGFGFDHLRALREGLIRTGVLGIAAAPSVAQLSQLAAMKLNFTHVFVNFDAFTDVITGVDELLIFRKAASKLNVVLCTATAKGDDFGSERKCICDATLRLPANARSLRCALINQD